jgi:hypothetical protein
MPARPVVPPMTNCRRESRIMEPPLGRKGREIVVETGDGENRTGAASCQGTAVRPCREHIIWPLSKST